MAIANLTNEIKSLLKKNFSEDAILETISKKTRAQLITNPLFMAGQQGSWKNLQTSFNEITLAMAKLLLDRAKAELI